MMALARRVQGQLEGGAAVVLEYGAALVNHDPAALQGSDDLRKDCVVC